MVSDQRKAVILEKLAANKTESKGKTLAKVVGGTALGAALGGAVGGPANVVRRLAVSVAKDARKAKALKKMPRTKRIARAIGGAATYSDGLAAAELGGTVAGGYLKGMDALFRGTIAGGVGGGALGGYLAGRKKKSGMKNRSRSVS